MANLDDEVDRTMFCASLSEKVTDEILYELFLQAGPLERVKIPTTNQGQKRNYAFVTFKHAISVPYTIELMNGIQLYGKPIRLSFKTGSVHEQNKQAQFNRSMSAPNMGHNTPPVPMNRNQSFAVPGAANQSHTSRPSTSNYHQQQEYVDRGRRRDRDPDRSDAHGWHKDRESDHSDHDRSRSRGSRSQQRSYDHKHSSDRDTDRQQRRYDPSPRTDRQFSRQMSDINPGMLPLMNPGPARNIDEMRQAIINRQQQQLQFNQGVQQRRSEGRAGYSRRTHTRW